MGKFECICTRKLRLDEFQPGENSISILNIGVSSETNGYPIVAYLAMVDVEYPIMEFKEYWIRPPQSWRDALRWNANLPYFQDITPDILVEDPLTMPPGSVAHTLLDAAAQMPVYMEQTRANVRGVQQLNAFTGTYPNIPIKPLVSLIPRWTLYRRDAERAALRYGLTPHHPRSMLLLQVDAYLKPKGLTLWDFLFETTE